MFVFTFWVSWECRQGWGCVSPVCMELILLDSTERGAMRGIQAVFNLINSCWKLTGEINCRMNHKQKPPKKEQINK